MAACALVAYADGKVDDAERDLVRQSLHTLDMIKHMNEHNGMDFFDAMVANLKTNADRGSRTAMASIKAMKSRPNVALVIVGICHTVAGADGVIDAKEQAVIERIAGVLGVAHQADQIISAAG